MLIAAYIIQVTLPIALLVALGFVAVKTRYFPADGIPVLAQFAARIALPAALFLVVAREDLQTVLDAQFILTYGTGTVCAALSLYIWMRLRGRASLDASVALLGGVLCNCMMVGLPITVLLFDPSTAAVMAIVSFFQDVIILPLVLVLADSVSGKSWLAALVPAITKALKNPFVIAILTGLLVSALSIELPAASIKLLEFLAASLAATGLFMIGGVLARFKLASISAGFLPIVAVKLVLHPLLVAIAFWLIPIENTAFMMAGIFAASLPMIGVYPVIAMSYGKEQEAATAMFVSTVASFITITLIMTLVLSQFGYVPVAG